MSQKTTPYINHDSSKKIERSDLGRSKFGSSEDKTDAAHKFGFGLLNTIETHTSGAPMGTASRNEVIREMNADTNLRIKTSHGNRVLDERRDASIAQAYVNHTPIEHKNTAERAHQAYIGASGLSSEKYAKELGEMRVKNPKTGGYYKLKNYDKSNPKTKTNPKPNPITKTKAKPKPKPKPKRNHN